MLGGSGATIEESRKSCKIVESDISVLKKSPLNDISVSDSDVSVCNKIFDSGVILSSHTTSVNSTLLKDNSLSSIPASQV